VKKGGEDANTGQGTKKMVRGPQDQRG